MPLMPSSLTIRWIQGLADRRASAKPQGRRNWTKTDAMCTFLVSMFTIIGPVLSFGWPFLSFRGIAIFLAAYVATQKLPNFFTMRLFEVVSGPFRCFSDYTACTFVVHEQLDPERAYIIGWHPHGRVFIGVGVLLGRLFEWLPLFREADRMVHVAINDAMFRLPLIGNWLYLLGMVPVNKHSIKQVLARGDSVCIVVGGIEEVLLGTNDEADVLYLHNRKGFVKIAMDSGAGLVPVFCFGENKLFDHSSEASLSFWRSVNAYVKLGAPFPIQGRWGLPLAFRRPLRVVWGRALFAQEGETVNGLHARYVEALRALHAAHVGETASPGRRLVIV